MPTLRRVDLDALLETPWAILPRTLSRIVEVVRAPAQDGALVALEGKHAVAQGGAVAVLPVYGVIEHRSDWMTELFGGTSVDGLRAQLRDALADPAVRAVVLDVDSPGGTVAGVTELQPGAYAVVCFLPDEASGKGHRELGMASVVEVS